MPDRDDHRRIDEIAARVADEHAAVGLVYGLVREGELTHAGGIGFADVEGRRPMDADTVLPIASITKTITTTSPATPHRCPSTTPVGCAPNGPRGSGGRTRTTRSRASASWSRT